MYASIRPRSERVAVPVAALLSVSGRVDDRRLRLGLCTNPISPRGIHEGPHPTPPPVSRRTAMAISGLQPDVAVVSGTRLQRSDGTATGEAGPHRGSPSPVCPPTGPQPIRRESSSRRPADVVLRLAQRPSQGHPPIRRRGG